MIWNILSHDDQSLFSVLEPSLRVMAGRLVLLCLIVWIYLAS